MIIYIPLDRVFHHATWVWYVLIVHCIITIFFSINDQAFRDSNRSYRARNIAISEDVRNIGQAIDLYLTMPYFSATRKSLREMIIHLLSNMQASDAIILTDTQRHRLYSFLQSQDKDLAMAAVKAVALIGDSSVIPYVRKLAAGQWSARTSKEVQAAAQYCVAQLERQG